MGNKFTDFNMKNKFEFPVYVAFDLDRHNDNFYIDRNKAVPGILKYEKGISTLQIDNRPKKRKNDKAVIFQSDYISNYKEGGTWYAETWDASLLFTIRKYYCKSWENPMRFDYVSWDGYSTWNIQEFDISRLFVSNESVKHLNVYMDNIFEYFNFRITPLSEEKTKSIDFGKIYYNKHDYFKLRIIEIRHSVEAYREIFSRSNAFFSIDFSKELRRDDSLKIAILLRDLFQILTNQKIGINKMIIGKVENRNRDYRKNWFTRQDFYSTIQKPVLNFSQLQTEYAKIQKDFCVILKSYFLNRKLQNLIRTYLITVHSSLPVSTTLVTLSSGIETYLNGCKYSDGKKIRNLHSKLKLVIQKTKFFSNDDVQEDFLNTIKNSRDYFVHGDKAANFVSEAELLPYIHKFSSIYLKFILNELLTTH